MSEFISLVPNQEYEREEDILPTVIDSLFPEYAEHLSGMERSVQREHIRGWLEAEGLDLEIVLEKFSNNGGGRHEV